MQRVALICAALILVAPSSQAETLTGRVVGISDGDTLTLLDASNTQHKIRLAGIDAPEKSQAFGQRSKENLSDLVFDKTVSVEWNKTDKYGRTIGKVIVGGSDANLGQVKAGLAWHYKEYEKEQAPSDRTIYAQAERDARSRRVGLWNDANPIPPWDFRHGTGAASADQRSLAGEACPCPGPTLCTGPKGGTYCITNGGKKSYR